MSVWDSVILTEKEVLAWGRVGFKKKQQPDAVSSRLGFTSEVVSSSFMPLPVPRGAGEAAELGQAQGPQSLPPLPPRGSPYQPSWPPGAFSGTAAESPQQSSLLEGADAPLACRSRRRRAVPGSQHGLGWKRVSRDQGAAGP